MAKWVIFTLVAAAASIHGVIIATWSSGEVAIVKIAASE